MSGRDDTHADRDGATSADVEAPPFPAVTPKVDLILRVRATSDTLLFDAQRRSRAPTTVHPRPPQSRDFRRAFTVSRKPTREEIDNIGRQIWNLIPPQIQNELTALAKGSDLQAASLLILTNEDSTPWELALMPATADRERAFVCERFRVGRWPICDDVAQAPSPDILRVSLAVVAGASTHEADCFEAEARHLVDVCGAKEVPSDRAAIMDWRRAAQNAWLHCASHGEADEHAGTFTLSLGKSHLEHHALADPRRAPGSPAHIAFAFLNCCEVGAQMLSRDTLQGFPAALLTAGARGMIGAIWRIDGRTALAVAERFYAATSAGAAFGETMRALRNAPATDAEPHPADRYAYVYFGHPDACLERARPPDEQETPQARAERIAHELRSGTARAEIWLNHVELTYRDGTKITLDAADYELVKQHLHQARDR